MQGLMNIATLALSLVTLPYAVKYLWLAVVSYRKNKLSGGERRAGFLAICLFLLLVLVSLFNIVIRVLGYFDISGGHTLSIYRSFISQLGALVHLPDGGARYAIGPGLRQSRDQESALRERASGRPRLAEIDPALVGP